MSARTPGTRYPERTRRRARQLYQPPYEWPLARIARELRVGIDVVRRWVADLRSEADPHARRYDRAAILAELAADRPRTQIRAEHGCSARFLSDLATGKLKP